MHRAANAPQTVLSRKINRLRKKLLDDCLISARLPTGLFSLTAPTGLGKTLAGLAFCLEHARLHRRRRVIYVAPYTSIIEQTASIYRIAVGGKNVLEHHSLFDPASLAKTVDEVDAEDNHDLELLWRLTVENWDAPIVVTTAVQFFESLFSARPGQCRKLHNICGSVVFLDEAQLIPPSFLTPILRALTELMAAYDVTVVLSTATQPALDPRPTFTGLIAPNGRERIEIVGGGEPASKSNKIVANLHRTTRRVQVEVRDMHQPLTWREIAQELASEGSSMCIVNTRQSARDLHALMPEGTIHLSALMCPAHRLEIINDIKARLPTDVLRVVTTQLVEAGVDLDFPLVYRALAGLDSLAQAAGRCNRNGLLAFGRLVVFLAHNEKLPHDLELPRDLTRTMLDVMQGDGFSPAMFTEFFRELFWAKGATHLDRKQICKMLPADSLDIYFRSASQAFQIIEDFREDVVVPWGYEGRYISTQLRAGPFSYSRIEWRNLLRRAQRYSVGIGTGAYNAISAQSGIQAVGKISVLDARFYDPIIGVIDHPLHESLII
jgi:CRISPR-associated endonuclease/helicase Cas3